MQQRQYISIGGVATRLSVSPSLIRKLENHGVIPPAARLEGSDRRVYQVADVDAIRQVIEARRRSPQREVAAVA